MNKEDARNDPRGHSSIRKQEGVSESERSVMLFLLLVVASFVTVHGSPKGSPKGSPNRSPNRSPNKTSVGALWNLNGMAECRLHYSAMVYDDYGCWCGPGGGGLPVDEIDRCCMNHDHCYDAAIAAGLCYDVPEEYVDWYQWSCGSDSLPICQVPDNRTCAAALCECDKIVVDCWSGFPKPARKARCNKTRLS